MPLRDHFRSPLDDERHWEGFHATWPVMTVACLRRRLPRGYFAEPRVHSGASAEIDITTFEKDNAPTGKGEGGVATATWAPPRPTFSVATELPAQDVYEVQVFDQKRHCRLVAAVEIVSPASKDRPDHREAFITKCAALLRERVSVAIVDIVTTRSQNLYVELLGRLGCSDSRLSANIPLYVAACRLTNADRQWRLETWAEPLKLGQPLPQMPLWLADNLAVPLELEESYEQSCEILGIS